MSGNESQGKCGVGVGGGMIGGSLRRRSAGEESAPWNQPWEEIGRTSIRRCFSGDGDGEGEGD